MQSHRLQRGITLLELIITLAVVSIIAALVFPDSRAMMARNRAENQLQELKKNLAFARTQATISESRVIICPLSGNQCTSDWSNHDIGVFVDENGNNSRDTSEPLLRTMKGAIKQDLLSYTGTSPIVYNATGRVGNNQAGTFTYCPHKASDFHQDLRVTQSGTSIYQGATSTACS